MNKFVWLDEYKIGDENIDKQHRYLFDLANQIVDPLNDRQKTYHNILGLYHYVREHFRDEELLMKECGYTDYTAHIKEHRLLTQKLSEITAGIISGEIGQGEVMNFMCSWLLEHILGKDLLLSQFLHGQEKFKAEKV